MSARSPGSLSFRAVYGDPAIPTAVISELARLKAGLRPLDWQFGYDLFVTVGGDLTVVTEPTALLRPRVMLAERRASGELRLNSDDVLRTTDPAALLRPAVHDALGELVTRVARRVPGFDAESERARFAFLRSSAVEGTPS
ncbi:hypothetical protein L3Q65_09305 [Amycolatopsis sp. FU40]|uniref:hypothetical protein n=1 Tax=Amycolatopsis sp. FU40 TaxID=2914159 RepID=UPI001F3F7F7D|nr:hypothetical protein [Amycolatopsis sp. FU40]UKD56898.1 hypothetical protein L3Q65_09305 [Amycolatopsis sp. FU40]